jgi:glutamate-1-semialdehyde 2,1-aminomutase
VATLKALQKAGMYERLEDLGAQLEDGLRGAVRDAGVRAAVARIGSMATLFFGVDAPPRDADEAGRCDTEAFGRYFRAMIDRGVYLPPSQFEVAFVSLAHSEAEIDATVAAASEALRRSLHAPRQ